MTYSKLFFGFFEGSEFLGSERKSDFLVNTLDSRRNCPHIHVLDAFFAHRRFDASTAVVDSRGDSDHIGALTIEKV
jgi:hypothetical protein